MAARWFLVGMTVAVVACNGPNKPTPPDPPVVGPATPPVVQAIIVPTSRVEAGQDITITAVVTDAETPLGQLVYTWSANVGTITGFGASVTWRHAAGLKQGADVVVTLTVVDTYDAVVNNQIVKQDFRVVAQAAPFRVHDSVAELKELSRKFLVDLFGNSSIPPGQCLVDFSDTCATLPNGKNAELDDIVDHRTKVVVQKVTIFSQTVSFASPTFAFVTSDAEFLDRFLSDGRVAPNRDEYVVTGVYEMGRWWLCQSYVDRSDAIISKMEAVRRKRRGDPGRNR